MSVEQCSAEITEYKPFIMGGNVNQTNQCKNDAEYIVTQKSDGESMPLCGGCIDKFWKLNKDDEDLYDAKVVE